MKRTLLGAFALVLIFQTAAFAAVVVGEGKRAQWVIQAPAGGKQVTVRPEESLPVIQDGSSIQVTGGDAQITTTGKSTVDLIEAVPFKLSENTTIKRTQAPAAQEVSIEVLAGQVTANKNDKTGLVLSSLSLDAGDQVRLKDGNLDVIKGEAVFSEGGKTTKLGAGKSLAGFVKPGKPQKA
jgi:hypothetical protein